MAIAASSIGPTSVFAAPRAALGPADCMYLLAHAKATALSYWVSEFKHLAWFEPQGGNCRPPYLAAQRRVDRPLAGAMAGRASLRCGPWALGHLVHW